ncbi:SpoIIE family protein phosphatase [Streptomyces sp. TS71-3]|uniref:SpoIIE family protein phosphatase n=1 Tax=Streptomyces sp. TS71-3 TaxID=2733862 RepID=UPI001B1A8421|nr:SpoIIE family protein phosphatase [Streptomyces sp. TS71-3]GHJ34826.1 hypothetical protein Sm713_04350 [Streptomyces sp. TS71-3]
MHGNEDSAAAPAAERLDLALVSVTRDAGAHLGALYLKVPERQVLNMSTVTGAPTRLARPWSRVSLAAPVATAEAARSGVPVWIPDQQELARRFPRTALSFPYTVAMYIVPLMVDGTCWGAVLLLWPGTRPAELSAAEVARIGGSAEGMARMLKEAADRGNAVVPRDEPLSLGAPSEPGEPAAALMERLNEGFAALDLQGRITFVNAAAARLLDRDPADLVGAEPWRALPWLGDPDHENAYLAAIFSRLPSGFAARRPDGDWLSFLLYPDATGISVRIRPAEAPVGGREPVSGEPPDAPARAGTLFHLLRLASALTEAADVDEVTHSLIDQMMPALGAQGLALLVAEEGRERVAGSGGFPQELPDHFQGQPLATRSEGVRTMESGVPGFHPTNAELLRTYPHHPLYGRMAAWAFIPLTVSGGTFGCLVLGYDRPRAFPPDERAELVSLAGLIAQALERARLYDNNARVARGLQDGLLPRRLPRVPGLKVAARYRPATHALDVGGDFYDLVDCGERTAGAVIGDVQGHSVQAATMMGQIRSAVHSHARVGASPEEVLARTNRHVLDLSDDMFCSCLFAHIDTPGKRVLLASAGHPPPILRHPDHRTEVLDLPPGLLLGVEEGTRFETVEVPVRPGALLALYTDGLVERPGTDLGESIDRLADQLAAAGDEPPELLADMIVKRAEETVVERSSDDFALLLVEFERGVP